MNPNIEENHNLFVGKSQNCEIVFGEVFSLEKTSDQFLEVKFVYDNYVWDGALPIVAQNQGFSLTEAEVKETAIAFCEPLRRENRRQWIVTALSRWDDKTSKTFKVFEALLSGEWECRVCGPVPQVNPQAAARIRDIKKRGFFIASRRRVCQHCRDKTMHDLLVMATPPENLIKAEFRKSISPYLNERVVKILERKETVFSQVRTSKELVIDHKFPSQRWSQPETDNNDNMGDEEIRNKFQLLNNQTNLLKSRECDRCVATGVRGQFMGIRWYYRGNERWEKERDDESGCIGCPWYDVSEWKNQLRVAIKKSEMGHLCEGN